MKYKVENPLDPTTEYVFNKQKDAKEYAMEVSKATRKAVEIKRFPIPYKAKQKVIVI